MGIFNVRQILLDKIAVDSIVFDRAVPEIFYFKHDVGTSNAVVQVLEKGNQEKVL